MTAATSSRACERVGDAARDRRPAAGWSRRPGRPECRRARRPRSATWRPPPRRRASRGSGRRSGSPSAWPVKARASRSARCEASVPEPVKRTISAHGTRRLISSAHRTSSSCEAPQCVPSGTCSAMASSDGGMAVAQQQRAMAAEVVDVLVAVDVPLAGAGGAGGVDRIGQQRAAVVGEAGRQHLAAPARRARPSAACAPDTRPRSWSSCVSLTLPSVSIRPRAR